MPACTFVLLGDCADGTSFARKGCTRAIRILHRTENGGMCLKLIPAPCVKITPSSLCLEPWDTAIGTGLWPCRGTDPAITHQHRKNKLFPGIIY